MKTPFKTKGIYARKINPEKELTNYKPTKLGSMWKAAVGEKDNAFYEIVWFSEIYSFTEDDSNEKKFCADYSNMTGEIFGLADWQKNRGFSYAKYKNVVYDESQFEFGDEHTTFFGSSFDDFLYLRILNKKTGESISEKLRYIPWI
jgi:hypothetical protein